MTEWQESIAAVLGQQIQASAPPWVPMHEVHPPTFRKVAPVGLPEGANVLQLLESPQAASMTAVAPPPPHVQILSELQRLQLVHDKTVDRRRGGGMQHTDEHRFAKRCCAKQSGVSAQSHDNSYMLTLHDGGAYPVPL